MEEVNGASDSQEVVNGEDENGDMEVPEVHFFYSFS